VVVVVVVLFPLPPQPEIMIAAIADSEKLRNLFDIAFIVSILLDRARDKPPQFHGSRRRLRDLLGLIRPKIDFL
jgi:hypothetical protein